MIATGAGAIVCILVPLFVAGGPQGSTSLLLVGFMFASIAIASLLGFIFGVPRARADVAVSTDEEKTSTTTMNGVTTRITSRFEANSNLEQISDWLTKILVGAGLVQLAAVPGALRDLGVYLGQDMTISGAEQISVAVVVYGVGVGFLTSYLWARLRLRVLLEIAEKEAESEWKASVLQSVLTDAEASSDSPVSARRIKRVANSAKQLARVNTASSSVLWADDHPENYVDLVQALKTVGIRVSTATSTSEALSELARESFALLVTDVGRVEDGKYNRSAGIELVEAVQNDYPQQPIVIFTGNQGLRLVKDNGKLRDVSVTTSPTELFSLILAQLAT
jgi:CheY-like chemotaxis protein